MSRDAIEDGIARHRRGEISLPIGNSREEQIARGVEGALRDHDHGIISTNPFNLDKSLEAQTRVAFNKGLRDHDNKRPPKQKSTSSGGAFGGGSAEGGWALGLFGLIVIGFIFWGLGCLVFTFGAIAITVMALIAVALVIASFHRGLLPGFLISILVAASGGTIYGIQRQMWVEYKMSHPTEVSVLDPETGVVAKGAEGTLYVAMYYQVGAEHSPAGVDPEYVAFNHHQPDCTVVKLDKRGKPVGKAILVTDLPGYNEYFDVGYDFPGGLKDGDVIAYEIGNMSPGRYRAACGAHHGDVRVPK
jgi:hypothetical protein